jgi:hypothetical protein
MLHFESIIHSQVTEKVKKAFIAELYKSVKYSLKSLKGPRLETIFKKKVKLNETQGSTKKFLFLDLDETLIFTNR